MLNIAHPKGIFVVPGDVRFSPVVHGRQVHLQTCLFASFSYACQTAKDTRSALANCRRWATDDGWLIFDVVNYACAAAHLSHSRKEFRHDGFTYAVRQVKSFDVPSGVVAILIDVTGPQGSVVQEIHHLRAFTPAEIVDALETAGWRVQQLFDPEGRPQVTKYSYYFTVAARAG
jgi:hypothetical protein